jgi:hypothetical protein
MRGGADSTSRLWIDDAPHFVIVFATPAATIDDDDDDHDDPVDDNSSDSHAAGENADNRRRRRAAFHAHIGELKCSDLMLLCNRCYQHANNYTILLQHQEILLLSHHFYILISTCS